MNYFDFLTRVIDDGIAAARVNYADQPHKCEGAVAGFEACRGKHPFQLAQLLIEANAQADKAFRAHDDVDNCWRLRCYVLEVEWVCNVVSCAIMNQDPKHAVIVTPTARGFMKAAEILGVKPIEASSLS